MSLRAQLIYRIVDSKGTTFHIHLTTWNSSPEKWEAQDQGFIRFTKGEAVGRRTPGTVFGADALLLSPNDTWGICLTERMGFWGENSKGSGVVVQPFVLSLEPGKISWEMRSLDFPVGW